MSFSLVLWPQTHQTIISSAFMVLLHFLYYCDSSLPCASQANDSINSGFSIAGLVPSVSLRLSLHIPTFLDHILRQKLFLLLRCNAIVDCRKASAFCTFFNQSPSVGLSGHELFSRQISFSFLRF